MRKTHMPVAWSSCWTTRTIRLTLTACSTQISHSIRSVIVDCTSLENIIVITVVIVVDSGRAMGEQCNVFVHLRKLCRIFLHFRSIAQLSFAAFGRLRLPRRRQDRTATASTVVYLFFYLFICSKMTIKTNKQVQ